MNNIYKSIIKKDLSEVTSSKQIYIPMLIVPLVFVIIIPIIMLIAIRFSSNGSIPINGLDNIMRKLPIEYSNLSVPQLVLKISINYFFPSLFLMIPIMASNIIGTSSFVGEREHRTMETLLYTPISIESIFISKVMGVFILSYVITLISFILFGVVINIGGMVYLNEIIFPNSKWLILILYVVPALTILGLSFTVLVSAKSKTFQEAQQQSGLIVIPIILLVVGQTTGIFLLTNTLLIIIATVILIIDYFLIKIMSKRFIPENLI
ncbi:ABC-type Na+ efflux pump permease subunit [Clostridium pascui]|uniref:ABC transporter permease subunit n=1 Tax=Clostridium pascui TaxID=46609 RepID=UPI0019594DAB|nr:ABC transporter permease subunit [Clostridium pascui]MBM7869170.1 ABC-type Na+ efflux pump permease subunit [Clostridium pascui]